MKELGCADMGGEGCDFRAKGDTAEDVKQQIYAHAAKAHPDRLAGMGDAEKAQMDAMMDKLLA